MQLEATKRVVSATNLAPSKNGVLVLSGYGLTIAVERGYLVVSDGVADERRHGRLHRATSNLTRLVLLGHTGFISLPSIRLLHDMKAALVAVDKDGVLLFASAAMGTDIPMLRRSQALAPWWGVGRQIAVDLLTAKLNGQAEIVKEDHPAIAETIGVFASRLSPHDAPSRLRTIEAQAAALYFQALSSTTVRFARRDESRVPEHWRTIGSRTSPLTSSPRSAVTPAMSCLNFLYALLEAECRIACLTMGLDPGLGVLHADLRSRDSLAADVMEAIRPAADAWLLNLLERRTFAAYDFFETRTGQCRVMRPLAKELAESLPIWTRVAAPVVERIAQQLLSIGALSFDTPQRFGASDWTDAVPSAKPTAKSRAATPLTQSNRSAGRPRNNGVARMPVAPRVPVAKTCRQCGAPLVSRKRTVCSDCHDEYVSEVAMPAFEGSGVRKLAELRALGKDPTKTPAAKAKLGATQRERQAAQKAWDRQHTGDDLSPGMFQQTILPLLQSVPLSVLKKATGLSLRYCSLIRQGKNVPHPMYFAPLARVAQARSPG